MKKKIENLIISLFALLAAAVSPNLFVIAEAGYSSLSEMAIRYLLPSIAFMILIIIAGFLLNIRGSSKQILKGIAAGAIATPGLEVVREVGYHLGGMPGDLPKLMGVLLLNRFALGPDTFSNIIGWSYHFWNGACFGVIYSIIFGRGRLWIAVLYGILIGSIFMVSPVVIALGVGKFGTEFNVGFPITVILAHIAYGFILGGIIYKWNKERESIFSKIKSILTYKRNES